VRLAGAADALQQYSALPVPPRVEAIMRGRIEAVRRDMDPDLAAAAWAEGQVMDLEAAIQCATGGHSVIPGAARTPGQLTAREREVAVFLAQGLTNQQIADRLVVSHGTVKRHVENILTKLDMTSRAQIATWAAEHKLLEQATATA